MWVVLDSAPLGLLSNPADGGRAEDARLWARGLVTSGHRLIVPEIADYEVRRELIRAEKLAGIARLDALAAAFDYQPLSTGAMRLAASLWAGARRSGRPTAADPAMDGDVILAAQTLVLRERSGDVVVATTNVDHLSRYAPARLWWTLGGGGED